MVINSDFIMNENWYSQQILRTYTRLETEAEVNSGVAYYALVDRVTTK